MRILHLSDLHGELPTLKVDFDVLVISGDICPDFRGGAKPQAAWVENKLKLWLEHSAKSKYVVMCWGNHDWCGQFLGSGIRFDNWRHRMLTDQSCEIEGVNFYGTPWQPVFYDWAFNAEPDILRSKFSQIPSDTDILISHGPPFDYCDSEDNGGTCLGSVELLERLSAETHKNIRATLCGHIHGGHGVSYLPSVGAVVNSSYMPSSVSLYRAGIRQQPHLIVLENKVIQSIKAIEWNTDDRVK